MDQINTYLSLPEVVHVRDPVAQILHVEGVYGDADPHVEIATAVTPRWNEMIFDL